MFNFPDAPAVSDEYISGGTTYIWDGSVWNLKSGGELTDYVLKAGDTMTGSLVVTGAASEITTEHRLVVNGSGDKTCIRMPGCEIRKTGEGNIELWTDNGGYSTTWGLKMRVGNPPPCEMQHLSFLQKVGSENDACSHISLWNSGSGGKGFGFGVTSGRLNYNTHAVNNGHHFLCGGVEQAYFNSDGLKIQGKFRLQTQSWGAQFHMPADTDEFVFNLGGSGGGDVYKIDNVGSTGNSVNVTAPEVVDVVRADPSLTACLRARKGDVAGEAVDLGALLIYALGEIKALKEEIATLRR